MTITPENFPSRREIAAALKNLMASQKADSGESLSDPLLQEIAWVLLHGARSVESAILILASPKAQRVLTNLWVEECPASSLVGAAVAPNDASEEAICLADANRELLELHTKSCAHCAGLLFDLERGLAALHSTDEPFWPEHFASFAWQANASVRSGGPNSEAGADTKYGAVFPLRRGRFQELTDEPIAEYQTLQATVTFTADEGGTLVIRTPLPRRGDSPRVVQVHVLLDAGHIWVAEAIWIPRYAPAGELVASYTGVGLDRPQIKDIDLKVVRHGE